MRSTASFSSTLQCSSRTKNAELRIDTVDPSYYTVADGDGQTTTAREATVDVGGDHANILKRLLIHTGAFNLGLLMRQLIGVGTPRGLQNRVIAILSALLTLIRSCGELVTRHKPVPTHSLMRERLSIPRDGFVQVRALKTGFTTGC